MKNMKTVLNQMANMILANVPDFDIDEAAVMQYQIPESFFVEMAQSRGWDKERSEHNITNEKEARNHMLQLLDDTIENIYNI